MAKKKAGKLKKRHKKLKKRLKELEVQLHQNQYPAKRQTSPEPNPSDIKTPSTKNSGHKSRSTKDLYGHYGSSEKEKLVLDEVVRRLGSSEFASLSDSKTDMHDGAIGLIETVILVEVQHRKRGNVCFDIISKLFDKRDLRGKSISPETAYEKLQELEPLISKNGKWGKHFDSELDADILAIKNESTSELFIFSTKHIAERIEKLIRTYGFSFNRKDRDSSKYDKHESAFVFVPVDDPLLQECLVDLRDDVLNELKRDAEKYHHIVGKKSTPNSKRVQPYHANTHQSEHGLIWTIIWILQQNGGRLSKKEVNQKAFEFCKPYSEQLHSEALDSGGNRWDKQIEGARWKATTNHQLMKRWQESGRGIWELTEKGKKWRP